MYKLAVRDYSSFEMRQLISKRASGSDQDVDPAPIVDALVNEGLIDDAKYVRNQTATLANGHQAKGPREIKRKLSTKGGIPKAILDEYVKESDSKWFDLARQIRDQTLTAKGFSRNESGKIPGKLFLNLKQKLYRRGFTAEQIRHALNGLVPVQEPPKALPCDQLQKQVLKLIRSDKGPIAILYHLKQKGAEETAIREALESTDTDWIAQAKDLIKKRFGTDKRLTRKERKKQSDFLLRRGFPADQIRAALNE